MNMRLIAIGLLAAFAGVVGGLAFVPGAIDSLMPKRGSVTVGKALVGGPFFCYVFRQRQKEQRF